MQLDVNDFFFKLQETPQMFPNVLLKKKILKKCNFTPLVLECFYFSFTKQSLDSLATCSQPFGQKLSKFKKYEK